jgi:tetratricopeptide (TPR) repeat protein
VQEAATAAQSNRLSDAERLYRQALELAPEEAALHGQLAAVLIRAGKTDEANAALRRQLELGGSGEEARRALADANQARSARRDQASAELQDLGRWGNEIERLKEIRTSQAITREQLAGLLTRYFPQLLEFRKTPQVMTDLPESWATPAIEAVVGVGLLDPTANHTFQPARTVNRGEFGQVMSRLVSRQLRKLQCLSSGRRRRGRQYCRKIAPPDPAKARLKALVFNRPPHDRKRCKVL